MSDISDVKPMELSVQAPDLEKLVEARFSASMAVAEMFFVTEADRISEACWSMARRFHAGGRLIAFGSGASATDAQHVAVEFLHPVIVGKRALPALALTYDSALLTGTLTGNSAGEASSVPFDRLVKTLGRAQDIALGFSITGEDANVIAALKMAKQNGSLTVGLTGGGCHTLQAVTDFCFAIPSSDAMVVQETQETLYHILWELVHLFFEHESLLK